MILSYLEIENGERLTSVLLYLRTQCYLKNQKVVLKKKIKILLGLFLKEIGIELYTQKHLED